MASNFNNDTLFRGSADDRAAAPVERRTRQARRWSGHLRSARSPRRLSASARAAGCSPPKNGNQEFCTHREVKPYAGTQGFDADAWCPECQYYKLRRAPKKRNPATTTLLIRIELQIESIETRQFVSVVRHRKLPRQLHPLAVRRELLIGPPVRPRLLRLPVLFQRHGQIEVRIGVGGIQLQRIAVACLRLAVASEVVKDVARG